LEEVEHGDKETVETEIFTQDYLIKRPLLEAIQTDGAGPPVLLIDEIDRADMEFEAFLLEVLSDFQITIPELGTIAAKHRRYVFLTSNPTREIHDALKRRCLYHWIEYPTFEKEYEIITTKFPEVETKMARQICAFMQKVREMNFYKRPGVAETLDWASALIALNRRNLDDKTVVETMGCVFKYREELHHLREQMEPRQRTLDAFLRASPEMVSRPSMEITQETVAAAVNSVAAARGKGTLPNLMAFARALKQLGVKVSLSQVIDASRSADLVDIAEKSDFRAVLRSN